MNELKPLGIYIHRNKYVRVLRIIPGLVVILVIFYYLRNRVQALKVLRFKNCDGNKALKNALKPLKIKASAHIIELLTKC